MKKLLLAAGAALGGVVAMRRAAAARAEKDLWHEATTAPDVRDDAAGRTGPAVGTS